MLHERIFLDDSDRRVYVDTYVSNDRSHVRPAMLVIPGGGYSQICTAREGEPIALAFAARDYNAFVLNYRVGTDGDLYPKQLIDASRAITHIKQNADAYGIDPERVFVVGFSAGGHLAGSLAILHSKPEVLSELGIEKGANKPRAVILSYPVVTAMAPTHEGTFENAYKKKFSALTEAEREALSLERHVTQDSAPVFIWHTAEDGVVPINGSLLLAQSYVDSGIPVTLHLYPYGPHGLALANGMTACGNSRAVQPLAEGWVDYACEWLKTI